MNNLKKLWAGGTCGIDQNDIHGLGKCGIDQNSICGLNLIELNV